jgi:FkbM family methyltransferase
VAIPFKRYAHSVHDYAQVLGLRGSLQWLLFRARKRFPTIAPESLTIHPRLLRHPIRLRAGASSDVDVFDQVIMGTEYQTLNDLQPRFIIDLGANVGLSSAYFLSTFPQANLLALEPDPSNYELCRYNLMKYGQRAQVLPGAAWSRRTQLALSHSSGDGREWASRVQDRTSRSNDVMVDGWDVKSLIERTGAAVIDLLKIDIERAETEVFANGHDDWLPSVRNICIELHDQNCRDVFFAALSNYDYQLSRSGELTICRNIRKKR